MFEPTRLTAGQAATTAPTRPCDQPWAILLGGRVYRTEIGPGETGDGHGSSSMTGWEEFGRSHLARTSPDLSQPS